MIRPVIVTLDGAYDTAERLDKFRHANPLCTIGDKGRTGSVPVSGKTRTVTAASLWELLDVMQALADLEAARAGLQAEYPGRRIWLSNGNRWYAVRREAAAKGNVLADDEFDVRPMTLDADDATGLREQLATERVKERRSVVSGG
jgi:hypothetical protein